MADDVIARIYEQYPSLVGLLGIPEVGNLLVQAVDPNVGFSPQTFEARLHETTWWRTTPEPQRNALIQATTDPATRTAELYAYGDQLQEIAARLGRWLDPNESAWLSAVGIDKGVSPDSATMRNLLRGTLRTGDVLSGQGTVGAAKGQIEELVRGEWFFPIADLNWLTGKAADVATGLDTLDSVNARLASQAWNLYPHLRQQITEGQTLADIFNPYRQIIADELEMGSVEQVDMQNPEWRKLMEWREPRTGELRMPTASEVMTMARDRPQWWKTSRGRQADAGMARTLLQAFGKVAA